VSERGALNMPYECRILERPDHLRVEVSGDWTPGNELSDSVSVWIQTADACREKGLTRVLSVWDVPGHLPPLDAYELGRIAESIGWERRFKLAVVHLHESRLKDSRFVETVVVNRGYQVKVFGNEPSALAWLLGS
jgi:hypothetical protein